MLPRGQEIDWDSIDKRKFFIYGAGSFSAVTTILYPMIVVKTRVQASHEAGSKGIKGAFDVARSVVRNDGILGLYRGYTTIIFGMIPGRMVYLTSLEICKSAIKKVGHKLDISETALSGISNTGAGALASLITQLVVVPIDIVSQRQMVATLAAKKATGEATAAAAAATASGAAPPSTSYSSSSSAAPSTSPTPGQASSSSVSASGSATSALNNNSTGGPKSGLHTWAHRGGAAMNSCGPNALVSSFSASASSSSEPLKSINLNAMGHFRQILKEEGVRGLYRGFGASVAVFVPSSALWWGSYGLYQRLLWNKLDDFTRTPSDAAASRQLSTAPLASTRETIMVQTASAVLAGTTASLITSPLDLVKTRIQVARRLEGQATTFRAVWREIVREEGYKGMFRGAVPRMANSALWGTCMVSTYEFLKRVAKKDL